MVVLPSVHLGTSPTVVAIRDPERGGGGGGGNQPCEMIIQ